MNLDLLKMDENLKNRILIILAVCLVIFLFGTLSSCNNAMRQKTSRDKEMAMRIALEERVSKFSQETSSLQEKAKAKEAEVLELKKKLEEIEKDLVQDQMINQSLKEELSKVTKIKEKLENDLKEALANEKKLKK